MSKRITFVSVADIPAEVPNETQGADHLHSVAEIETPAAVPTEPPEPCAECAEFNRGEATYKHDLVLGCTPTCPCNHDHAAVPTEPAGEATT